MTNIRAIPLHELKNDLAAFEMQIEACRKLLASSRDPSDIAILEGKIDMKAKIVNTIHEELARRQHPELEPRQP